MQVFAEAGVVGEDVRGVEGKGFGDGNHRDSLGFFTLRGLAACEEFGKADKGARKEEHEGGERKDGGQVFGVLRHRAHVGWEGVGARAVDEGCNHDIVNGECESEEAARDDAGHEDGELHFEEGRPWARAEVVGGFDEAVVKVLQACEDGHDNVGHAKGHVRDENGPEAAINMARDKEHQERDTNEDVRHDERRVDEGVVNRLETVAPTVQGERGSCAEDARDDGREARDGERKPEALHERLDRVGARKDLLVPLRREANKTAAGIEETHRDAVWNKAVDDHENDGHVKEGQHEAQHHHGEE